MFPNPTSCEPLFPGEGAEWRNENQPPAERKWLSNVPIINSCHTRSHPPTRAGALVSLLPFTNKHIGRESLVLSKPPPESALLSSRSPKQPCITSLLHELSCLACSAPTNGPSGQSLTTSRKGRPGPVSFSLLLCGPCCHSSSRNGGQEHQA